MKQQLSSLWNLIKVHPLYAVLAVGVTIAVLFVFSNAIGSRIEHWRASRFDAKQAVYEKQITDLKTEREALIKQANDAEAKAVLKEAEAKELRDLIQAKGGQIEVAAKELEKKLEQAKQDAGDCQALPDVDARTKCLCDKLKRAGFECS
jgi:uncharacterized coiled-coil DUF342 family protein